jgi:hypothetical protein
VSDKRENPIPPWQRIAVDARTAADMLGLSQFQFARYVRDELLPKPALDRRWSVEALRPFKDAPPSPPKERRPKSVSLGPGVTHLYRHFDGDGRLLYVGISLSAIARLAEHKAASHWFWQIARIEVTAYATRSSALKAERISIQREKPLRNIAHARSAC